MVFISLIRFFKGVVGFTLQGGFTERFLNLCIRAGLPVFNTRRYADHIEANTTARSYKKMRPIAKKTGVRLRLQSKSGLPFWLTRYRKRVGLLAGVVLFALFLGVMSRFIWSIELEGNETLADSYILEHLEECGVREGAYIGGIDTLAAERQMIALTPELSWIAINLRASTASVEMRERDMPPEMIDVNTPCNVVAARTGQIVEMEVYAGEPVLRVGDTVQEGELLVSAYVGGIKARDIIHMAHARAKVVAEFTQEVEIRVPLREEIRQPVGETATKRSLEMFGLRVPLYFSRPKGPCDLHTKSVQPIVLGLQLPLKYVTDTYQPVSEHTVTLTEEEAREEALSQLTAYEQDFSKIGRIVSKASGGEVEDGVYVVHAQFVLQQNIARQKSIEVDGLSAAPEE